MCLIYTFLVLLDVAHAFVTFLGKVLQATYYIHWNVCWVFICTGLIILRITGKVLTYNIYYLTMYVYIQCKQVCNKQILLLHICTYLCKYTAYTGNSIRSNYGVLITRDAF